MKTRSDTPDQPRRPRLKKETLRGLGFEELAAVHGGKKTGGTIPFASRNCLDR